MSQSAHRNVNSYCKSSLYRELILKYTKPGTEESLCLLDTFFFTYLKYLHEFDTFVKLANNLS